jgi:hypothetical protein
VRGQMQPACIDCICDTFLVSCKKRRDQLA